MTEVVKQERKDSEKSGVKLLNGIAVRETVINSPVAYKIEHVAVLQLLQFMDEFHQKVLSESVTKDDFYQLFIKLDKTRRDVDWAYWREVVIDKVLNHPLAVYIHEDPCTNRSFEKPRGYAGDAELIEYFYTLDPKKKLSKVGKLAFDITVNDIAGFSVRERAMIVSENIDRICEANPKARILSIACGHVLELSYSKCAYLNSLGEFVGLDQDIKSLEVAKKRHQDKSITLYAMSIKDLFKNPESLGTFDFIYSSGLYDYLNDKVARKLNKTLFSMLNKNGELMITNFTPSTSSIGYMETFMRWDLIYRELSDMEAITNSIPSEMIERKTTFRARTNSIIYTKLQSK